MNKILNIITPADQTPAPPQEKPYYARYYKIGQHYSEQGGVYAGIASGDEGKSAYHLFVGPKLDGGRVNNWHKMRELAHECKFCGFEDFVLPSPREQTLIWANAPLLFDNFYFYWSGLQLTNDSDLAWVQNFESAVKYTFSIYQRHHARPVRRVTVQPSNNLILDRSALEFKNKATPGGVSFFKTETTLGVSDILIRASEPTLVTGSGFKTADLNLKIQALEPNASEKISKLAAAIVAFAAFLAVSGYSIFEPRVEVMPVAQALRDMPPAMRTAMQDLSSPAFTAALRRAQGNLDEVKK